MTDSITLNLYEILGIFRMSASEYPDVSLTEIKSAYRMSLLSNHPDKQIQQTGEFINSKGNKTIAISAIKTAYLILTTPDRRKEYDSRLRLGNGVISLAVPKVTGEQVDLDDMNTTTIIGSDGVTETFIWTRGCRCGESEGYILSERDLEDNGPDSTSIIIQCVGCSLWIEVLYEIQT